MQRCGQLTIRVDATRDIVDADDAPFIRIGWDGSSATISGIRLMLRDVPRLPRWPGDARNYEVEQVG